MGRIIRLTESDIGVLMLQTTQEIKVLEIEKFYYSKETIPKELKEF